VELGEGIVAICRMSDASQPDQAAGAESKVDLSSLTSMLNARWKGGSGATAGGGTGIVAGQVRGFRIVRLDPAAKKIELEPA
jgi:small subunit ribosomal protein S1